MLLNCHTEFSIGYGIFSPQKLLLLAKQNNFESYTITDINTTSAVLESLRLAKEYEMKVDVGVDFRNGIQQQYIGIAKNNLGFQELNKHLTFYLQHNTSFEKRAPIFENVFIIYPLKNFEELHHQAPFYSVGEDKDEVSNKSLMMKFDELQPNEFIGIQEKELLQLQFISIKKLKSKLVILQPVTFSTKQDFNAHRLLRAIDKNVLLSKLPKEEQALPDAIMPSKALLYEAFKDYDFIIENTEQLLAACNVHFEMGKLSNKNLKFYTNSLAEDVALLRNECIKGLPYRYKNPSNDVMERIEKELKIIEQMNFTSYFLINWDIVKYAQSKSYFYVGRGSGANSMVAYLLRITDVDPIELDLYFERFINIHRTNPPDFDIDFNWTDRDDITRYIFERFGKERTALLATYSTFQKDAVIRELGKVFGLPPQEIDKLQHIENWKNADSMGKLVLQYSQLIADKPSHLSIHASGIIISEEPISAYTATFMPPKGYPTTQFSMQEAEDIGMAKFDILSQRGLGKIKDALEIIKQNHGVEIDIHDVEKFKTDERVKKLLSEGRCIGCFYIESPAMRMLLSKLQADDYLRLVAASSIIRPGVSKSGMMNEYILRYRNEERRNKAQQALPELYEILKETYGVMVYQEDVIKVAHKFAGLSLADADYLRRGMSWKFKQRNEFHVVKDKFFENCKKKNHSEKTITEIWNQIESFANYAFSKAHSASYAVESFQALYLKAYFPLEYMTAVLNNGGGFYRTELYVHEARMHGAKIVAPCINHSDVICTIEGETIYLGLQMINEIEHQTIQNILTERATNGFYKGLYDFIKRVPISMEQLILLIRVGAFNFSGCNKKELLWQAHMQLNPIKKPATKELFDVKPKLYQLPKLYHTWFDDAMDEIELLGFALCSPFLLLKNELPTQTKTVDFKNYIGKEVSIVGYLVSVKRTYTHKGDKMNFGTFIDLEGNWIDTVHFPPSAKAYPFVGSGCYLLKGKVVEEFSFSYINVKEMKRLANRNRDDMLKNLAEVKPEILPG
jgi:DNA polymerase III subunit alpha